MPIIPSRSVVPWSASSPAESGGTHRGAHGWSGGSASLPLTALFPVPFVVLLLLAGWIAGELLQVLAGLGLLVLGTVAALRRITRRSVALMGTLPPPVQPDPPRVQPAPAGAGRRPVKVTAWVADAPTGRLERAPLALTPGPVRAVPVLPEVRLTEPV